MDSTVGQEAHQVQFAAGAANGLQGFKKNGIDKEITLINTVTDTGQILVDNATCTDVKVADFRVAHLALWQADVETTGTDAALRIFCIELIMKRSIAEHGGITVAFCAFRTVRIFRPSIANDGLLVVWPWE